ncbi:MAG: TVP38/TMEM64 family protein [Anaerolineaceae bacterium]
MPESQKRSRRISRPSLDSFVFDDEETPLLLRGRVVAGLAVAFVALATSYLVLARALGWSYDINAAPFREWVDSWGAWGPVVFVAVMALSVLFAPIPNFPIFVAAGLAWGPVVGTVYSMAGLLIGSTLAFYVSRRFGRRHLPRLIGGRATDRLDSVAQTMGGRVVFWSRMLPAVNFDWISFVAGMTSIRFAPFFVASALGMLLPTWVAVAAGDGLGRDVRITFAYGALWVGAIVASAAYFWYRRNRSRPPVEPANPSS